MSALSVMWSAINKLVLLEGINAGLDLRLLPLRIGRLLSQKLRDDRLSDGLGMLGDFSLGVDLFLFNALLGSVQLQQQRPLAL